MDGLGWNDMTIEQGLQKIARLIVVMTDDEILGMVTNISLTQNKWSIGFNPLQNHKLLTPHNKLIWLRIKRNFMMELGIQIIEPIHAFPLLQENDEYLMQKQSN
jgi:hypothetical protein